MSRVLFNPLTFWFSRHYRPRVFTFRPPKNNRIVIELTKGVLPLILRLGIRVEALEIREEDLKSLEGLKGQRVILTPSHSGGFESFILFHLSKLLGEEFHYLAGREIFEPFPLGWLLQRLGVYSIIRGTPDRESFRMTHRLLVEGKRWLVIFPEGEVCWHNDRIMPFQHGVARLAFHAYEDLTRLGKLSPLYLVPVAVKYIYLHDMSHEIDSSLQRLEQKLFSTSNTQSLPLYDRLRRVGEAVLSANEKEYHVHPREDASLEERIQHIKELIISHAATVLGISLHPEQSLYEHIIVLFNTLDQLIYDKPPGSDYERELHHHRQREAPELYNELYRILHFIALHDGYVRERMTAERFLDVLGLLEWEVFRRRRIWGPRKALVKIGKPLNLGDYYSYYQTDRRSGINKVTTLLESSVRQMLTDLSHESTAIKLAA